MDVELINNADHSLHVHGHLAADEVRRCVIGNKTDAGAAQVVIPKAVADSLGLPFRIKTRVTFDDGRQVVWDVVGDLLLRVCGRESTFQAIAEPGRKDVLIGSITLDALDLAVDPETGTCSARDPEEMTTFV